jgi:hypothetical protein
MSGRAPRCAAGCAAAGACVLLLLTWPSSSTTSLLQFVRPYSLADGEVVYRPPNNRARISFLPMRMLEMEYPPSYNNHKLREAACFGFDRNPGDAVPWTPDGVSSHPLPTHTHTNTIEIPVK